MNNVYCFGLLAFKGLYGAPEAVQQGFTRLILEWYMRINWVGKNIILQSTEGWDNHFEMYKNSIGVLDRVEIE